MQMRFSSISGSADARQHLPTPHTIPCFHAQTPGLQMHVISKLAATQVERDGIARHRFQCNWHGGVERVAVSGDVLGKSVSGGDNATVRNGKHLFSVGVIGVHVPRVARKCRTILDLFPVDGESARVDRLPIENDDSTPVMIVLVVAWPVFREPVGSFYRRAEHTQLSVMCGNDRAFFWSVSRGHAME